MRISEIFYSIQGEGALTGVPSVFIRTSGCNLRCAWCDTPYASWNPEGEEIDIEIIIERVLSFSCRHVVLTGGEPMIAKGIHDLAARLKAAGLHVTIETAGTVGPDGIDCDLASLSPKLSNSIPSETKAGKAWVERHENTRCKPDVIDAWIRSYDFQLKFVVSNPEDWTEILGLTRRLPKDIPPHKILLMPEGTDPATIASRRDWLLELCKEHGYRFCHRLHIDIFGNTRGT